MPEREGVRPLHKRLPPVRQPGDGLIRKLAVRRQVAEKRANRRGGREPESRAVGRPTGSDLVRVKYARNPGLSDPLTLESSEIHASSCFTGLPG